MGDELDRLYDKVEKEKTMSSAPATISKQSEEDEKERELSRRRLIAGSITGAALLAVGGTAGWFASRSRRLMPGGGRKEKLPARLDIGIEEHYDVDEDKILYKEVGKFETGFHNQRRVAVGPDDRVFVLGDQTTRIFDMSGKLQKEIKSSGLPHCLEVAKDGRIFMAAGDHIEIYSNDGTLVTKWAKLGNKVYMTALALTDDAVFVADARNREIVKYDLKGKEMDRFGKKDPARKNPGIVVPSPYFDLLLGNDGNLHLINPGRHRVERYSQAGSYQSSWGKPGIALDRFSGCCNPVYLAFLQGGEYVTSEKGLLRVKLYDAEGKFLGVVAGPKTFIKMGEGAAANFRLNKGIDVSVDTKNRVVVSSPYGKSVHIFERKQGSA